MELLQISQRGERRKPSKPDWLRIRAPSSSSSLASFQKIKHVLRARGLVTVCEEAHCPNMAECWANESTATFMVMGDTCTRACKFCNVKTHYPGKPLDPDEPRKLAEAIAEIGLDYAVVTSVNRDDLKDQGAGHFAACIREIKRQHPDCLVEVLIPDFRGSRECVQQIIDAKPDVIAHNIETTRVLTPNVRDPRAKYDQSLAVLKAIKGMDPRIFTKSSIMVGLGETDEDVMQTMNDLRAVGVSIFTIGQYLRPSDRHLPVVEYVHPSVFEKYKHIGEELGFAFVAAGPFVRSSYRAGELFVKHILEKH